jgi:hypothetical protein
MVMEGNKLVKFILDDFQFSGAEIASGGEPIFLGVSGTIYSGNSSSHPATRTKAASMAAP